MAATPAREDKPIEGFFANLFAGSRYRYDKDGKVVHYPDTYRDPNTGEELPHPKAGQPMPKDPHPVNWRNLILSFLGASLFLPVFLLLFGAFAYGAWKNLRRNNPKLAALFGVLAAFTFGAIAIFQLASVMLAGALTAVGLGAIASVAPFIVGAVFLIGLVAKVYGWLTSASERDAEAKRILSLTEAPVKFEATDSGSLDNQLDNTRIFCTKLTQALHADAILSATTNPDPKKDAEQREQLKTRLSKQIDQVDTAIRAADATLAKAEAHLIALQSSTRSATLINTATYQRNVAQAQVHQLACLRAQLEIRYLLQEEPVNDTKLAAARAELENANRQLEAASPTHPGAAPATPGPRATPGDIKTYNTYVRKLDIYNAAQRVLAGGKAAETLLKARDARAKLETELARTEHARELDTYRADLSEHYDSLAVAHTDATRNGDIALAQELQREQESIRQARDRVDSHIAGLDSTASASTLHAQVETCNNVTREATASLRTATSIAATHDIATRIHAARITLLAPADRQTALRTAIRPDVIAVVNIPPRHVGVEAHRTAIATTIANAAMMPNATVATVNAAAQARHTQLGGGGIDFTTQANAALEAVHKHAQYRELQSMHPVSGSIDAADRALNDVIARAAAIGNEVAHTQQTLIRRSSDVASVDQALGRLANARRELIALRDSDALDSRDTTAIHTAIDGIDRNIAAGAQRIVQLQENLTAQSRSISASNDLGRIKAHLKALRVLHQQIAELRADANANPDHPLHGHATLEDDGALTDAEATLLGTQQQLLLTHANRLVQELDVRLRATPPNLAAIQQTLAELQQIEDCYRELWADYQGSIPTGNVNLTEADFAGEPFGRARTDLTDAIARGQARVTQLERVAVATPAPPPGHHLRLGSTLPTMPTHPHTAGDGSGHGHTPGHSGGGKW